MDNRPAGRRLGEHVRQLRIERGWKIEDVARRLNWSTSYLQYLETRKMSLPEPPEMMQLAEIYETTRDELLIAAGHRDAPALAGER